MPYTDNTLILLPMFKKGHQRIIKEKDYDSIPVQECIPVGCAAVAVCWGGGGVSACQGLSASSASGGLAKSSEPIPFEYSCQVTSGGKQSHAFPQKTIKMN